MIDLTEAGTPEGVDATVRTRELVFEAETLSMSKDVAERLGITEQTPFKEKLKKMKGLTLGATRPGTLTYNQGEYWIRKAGYTPQQEVKLIG
ncbi:MAG: hypothetical protein ACE5JD_13800, partial [Candidatus Methylomirabilia bacterium]